MKEQKVLITDNDRDINSYIDKGWIVTKMIPIMIATSSSCTMNGKICFLLEKQK